MNDGGRVISPNGTGHKAADPGKTLSTSPDDTNVSSYLSEKHVRPFFIDGSERTLWPEGDLRQTFNGMSLDDRTRLRAACFANQNPKYDHLCTSVGAM